MLQTFSTVPKPLPQTAPLTVLITGAARGIGFELVRQYSAAYATNTVLAAVRDTKAAGPLTTFASTHPNVHIIPLDAGSEDSINASVAHLPASVKHIDLLFNNAGVIGSPTPLPSLTAAGINDILRINVTGPLLVVRAYAALLKAAASPMVVNIGSELGASKFAGQVAEWGVIPYGASKAALSFISLALKTAVPEVTFLDVSPGWVGTDMGGAFNTEAPVKTVDCVSALREMAQSKGKADSGKFFDVVTGNEVAY